MSRTTTSSADFWSGSAPFTTLPAAGATLFAWYKSTAIGADGQFVSVDSGTIDSNTWSLMVGSGGVAGQAGAYTWSSGGNVVFANAAGSLPNSVWRFVAAVFPAGGASRSAYNNTTKGTNSSFVTPPTGINGMHYNGISSRGIAGECAHRGAALRNYGDIELAYLAGGGNPSYLGAEHYHQLDSSGTESDIGSSGSPITMTVHGTTAGSDDPDFASYWTAAALGAQSWTQGSAISSIDLTTKFRDVHSASTYTVQGLSAGTQVTTANGTATTASNLMTVNDASGIVVGSYVSDGPTGTKYGVLFKSGNTLLLAGFTTWVNTDPIYVYTATTKTFTGLTLTAGVIAGTPAGADVGTYFLIPRRVCNANSALIADGPGFTATVASSGAAPSFSAGPTLTSTQTDGHTFAVTSNQTATCWLGYYLKGSAQPGAPALIAGTGTGVITTAGTHVSQSLTAAVAGSITSTGLLDAIADGYLCLTNGSGNSAVIPFTALMKAAPAGKQYAPITVISVSAVTKANPVQITTTTPHGLTSGNYTQPYGLGGMVELNALFTAAQTVQCTVLDATNVTLTGIDSTLFTTYTSGGYLSFGASMYAQASTLPVTGDIGVWDTVTAENGLPVTAFPNGRYSIAAGSVTSRQSWAVDFYKVSTGAYIGVATDYVANQPPLLVQQTIGSPLPAIFLPANQTIPSTNVVTPFAQDPEGDLLGASFLAVPSGIVISGQNATGTTGAAQILQTTETFTDKPGDQTQMGMAWVIGKVNPPDLRTLTQAAVDRLLAAIYLTATYANQDDPNPAGPAPAGTVIAQNPPFGVPVDPNTTVINVSLSTGASTGGGVTPTVQTVKSALIILLEAQPPPGMPVYVPGSDIISRVEVLPLGTATLAGSTYRFIRIPSNAIVRRLSILNDSNPSGSSYRAGVLLPTGAGGGPPVAGADSIFFSGLSLDNSRLLPVSVLTPTPVTGAGGVAAWTQQIWQLMGLSQDPQQIYDLAVTAQIPGAAGGNLVLMVDYGRGSAWLHAVNL